MSYVGVKASTYCNSQSSYLGLHSEMILLTYILPTNKLSYNTSTPAYDVMEHVYKETHWKCINHSLGCFSWLFLPVRRLCQALPNPFNFHSLPFLAKRWLGCYTWARHNLGVTLINENQWPSAWVVVLHDYSVCTGLADLGSVWFQSQPSRIAALAMRIVWLTAR